MLNFHLGLQLPFQKCGFGANFAHQRLRVLIMHSMDKQLGTKY